MHTNRVIYAALLIVGTALAGCASEPAPKAAPAKPASAPVATSAKPSDPNRVTCQSYVPTGSRVETYKQCFTPEEKAQADEDTRRAMRDMQNTPALPQTSPMAPSGH